MKIQKNLLIQESNDHYPVDNERAKVYGISSPIKDDGARKVTDTIVLHYTASSSLEGAIQTLYNNPLPKVSAHIVIDRNGKIHQLMPLNKQAWHAGKSNYNGRTNLNRYSIGIELENKGELEKSDDGIFSTWYGKNVLPEDVETKKYYAETYSTYWHKYTLEQIECVIGLCLTLSQKYDIKDVLGHNEIAPTRKRDPGAAFPLAKVKTLILENRGDSKETKQKAQPNEIQHNKTGTVAVSKLNIRQSDSIDAPKIAMPLSKTQAVTILEQKADWYRVETKISGWVASKYISIDEPKM